MTEEIIIDGVDVAGCKYMLNNKIKGKQHCPAKAMPYAKETSCICRKSIDTPYNFCKHNPNCHYKQLKRLEQENKELKIKLSSTKCHLCGEGFLTPEGAELYEENKALQAYKDINEDFKKAWGELNEKYKQLRSALEEIQKVIKSYDLTVDNGASVDTLYTIRKIINEVLGDN